MQKNELFEPSLSNGWVMPKSYSINAFFLVAILGGTFPLVILGTLNALWLRISKKAIYSGVIIGSILFLSEPLLVVYLSLNHPGIGTLTIPLGFRVVGSLLLYFYYIYILKKPFEQFIYLHGKTVRMVEPAVIYSFIGIMLREGFLVILGFK